MSLIKTFLSILYKIYFPYRRFKKNTNKYDLEISIYSAEDISDIQKYDTRVLSYFSGRLYVQNPSRLKHPYTTIVKSGKSQLVGIKCWHSSIYCLAPILRRKIRPLLLNELEYIFWESGYLYRKSLGKIKKLARLDLESFMYSEMIKAESYYILRSGASICISQNLYNWETIYIGKRGIQDSMITVGTSENLSLLFIEYSPGKQRTQHRILRYTFSSHTLKVVMTFHTYNDYCEKGVEPCARHLHVIAKDPYTGDIYVGSGDTNAESSIYRSNDNGQTFVRLFGGSQNYRALSFMFTEHYVYWNTDTYESQSIFRMNKADADLIDRFPLINGALWCAKKYPSKINEEDIYIMSSNSEGALYDNNNRVYGIVIEDNRPIFYELLSKPSRTEYSQQFLLGFDDMRNVYLYDHEIDMVTSYVLLKK